MERKLFVYIEDEQMYWHNHVLMAQEGGQSIDINGLEKLSWKHLAAGRISTDAELLIEIAKEHGLILHIIERRRQSNEIPTEWAHLPAVRGATGNY